MNELRSWSIAAVSVLVVLGGGGYFGYRALSDWRQETALAAHWQTVGRYCTDCHNDAENAGGLSLEALRGRPIASEAKAWEQAIRKLRAGLMPPAGEPRPSDETLAATVAFLEGTLDDAARDHPTPGAAVLRRLNRTEYANAVRDLLDLPIDAAVLLPADDSSAGFDNISAALSVSPALLEAYVAAASKISRLAVGDPTTSPGITTYTVPRDLEQANHTEGLPLGTRGGLTVTHVFPLDAEYEIVARRGGAGFGLRAVGSEEPIEITLDGERLHLLEGRQSSVRLKIPAGPHELGVAMIAGSRPRGIDDMWEVWAAAAGIPSVSITGPLAPTGAGDTPSRRRIFVCQPTSAEDEARCAREIVRTLATRAFRRPVEDGDSLATLMEFYGNGRELRGFDGGVQYALARILVDPQFIFRLEEEPENVADGGIYPVGAYELASRLSFFLWSSIPDDELLAAARDGRLLNAAGREQQVRRMLADSKSGSLATSFAKQWLGLQQLATAQPTTNEFDGNLRRSFERETELLFEHVVREDKSIVAVLDADYTFVDERLARHYALPHVRGSRFRKVDLPDGARRGVLGHGSVLTVTSSPTRTSPVIRGAWVLRNLLGTPPPSPPPGVETNLDESSAAGTAGLPLRARLERHRADPGCASCHAMIDPLGFALENFDPIGGWRETDNGVPVDTSGALWDGTRIDGAADLRAALLERRELFVTHAAEMLLTYALGRALEPTDMPAVRDVVRAAAKDDYRFSALVLGIAESVPFRMKTKQPAAAGAGG